MRLNGEWLDNQSEIKDEYFLEKSYNKKIHYWNNYIFDNFRS